MKTRTCLFITTLAACLPASGIAIKAALYNGDPFEYVENAFDTTIQTDPLGSEDATSVKATAIHNMVGNDVHYEIDFVKSIGGSKDLASGSDIGIGDTVELRIEMFAPGYQKFDRLVITGGNLTELVFDESGATYGYPSLELKIEPTTVALSANYQTPVTARLGMTLYFDAAFDGLDNDYQTVIVTNAPREDIGDATHPSSAFGLGLTHNYSGLEDQPATFRYFLRSGLVDSYGGGEDWDDVQGSINSYTFPSGLTFIDRGAPISLGVTYDHNIPGETYRAFDLSYDNWDGTNDLQLGTGFAPVDQDYDGLPDTWEDAHGFDKTTPNPPGADADGDLQSEWQEFLQGTNPNDATSKLEVTMVDYMMPSGDLELTWTSKDDKDYEVEGFNPATLKWAPVPSVGIVPGQPGLTSYSIENANAVLGDNILVRVAVSLDF